MTNDTAEKTDELSVPATAPAPAAELTEGNRVVPQVSAAIPEDEVARITADLIGALKTVYDPEIPVDIYELGLIYKVDLDDNRNLTIDMTLTAPGCPVAGTMPGMVKEAVEQVDGIGAVDVELVWDPPWDQSRMSDEAKLELGWL
jgi:FeS assembly SUF system protein